MYVEGKEALFWADVGECASRCQWALAHEDQRSQIAAAGQARNAANRIRNESVMNEILTAAFAARESP